MSKQISEDPFLCPECSKFGYCIRRAQNNISERIEKHFGEQEVRNKVPIKSVSRDAFGKFGKKLQQAHDLFHQGEFEHASYLYLDMLESRNDCDEVKIGLAACLFFLEKYEEAFGISNKLSGVMYDTFKNSFTNLCIEKIKSAAAIEVMKNKELDESTAVQAFKLECCNQKQVI